MRAHGQVDMLLEVGGTDHACWVYSGHGDLDAGVGRFLDGGLARGERLLGVGEVVIESLRRQSIRHGGSDALAARGTLETMTTAEAYAATGRFVPERQFDFYDAATRRALADGFTGLRVIADVSPLAEDVAARPDLIRWEHMADDYAAHGPGFTAMCVYRSDLGGDALADVASVHPQVHGAPGLSPFQVFFDDGRVVLAGSVDTFGAGRLEAVLGASHVDGEKVLLDMALLEFVDVAGCRVLAGWANEVAARGGQLEVTGASRTVQRMWRILALHGLAPVTFVGAEP